MTLPRRVPRDLTAELLTSYLADVRRIPVPTPEEDLALARRIQEGDENALQDLVKGHLRFVVQIARKYQGYGLPLSDLINEGNLGLMHAAGKFDPKRGARFITYLPRPSARGYSAPLVERAERLRSPPP